jgi:hypothetical protein
MLRIGYTGGAVDVYTPFNPPDTKVYVYDINSMYPYVMSKYDYPVGNPIFFVGSRDIIAENLYAGEYSEYSEYSSAECGNVHNVMPYRHHCNISRGFMRVKVTAPLDLETPLLQVRITNKTICGLGTWESVYFSEELKLARRNLRFGASNFLWAFGP